MTTITIKMIMIMCTCWARIISSSSSKGVSRSRSGWWWKYFHSKLLLPIFPPSPLFRSFAHSYLSLFSNRPSTFLFSSSLSLSLFSLNKSLIDNDDWRRQPPGAEEEMMWYLVKDPIGSGQGRLIPRPIESLHSTVSESIFFYQTMMVGDAIL